VPRIRFSAAIAVLGVFVLTAPSAPAVAEGGLFGAILNALGRAIAPPHHSAPLPIEVPGNPLSNAFAPGSEIKPAEGGPQVAFCVRTCDGRYFPIVKSAEVTLAKMCHAMCPAAETEIYSGSNIENAVSQRGNRYTSLANAFLYREKMVEGCSCNGKSPVGTASIDYRNDPTLRPGDIVMTEDGPVVFRGAVAPAHKMSDFVPVKDSKRVSDSVRTKVIALKAMPTRQAQAQVKRAATAKEAAAFAETLEKKGRALGFAD
jgi:hypothetical protein